MAALNWVKSLDFEIVSEHGNSPEDQMRSCREKFSGVRPRRSTQLVAPIFAPLFHCLTFSVSLISIDEGVAYGPWSFPAAVISWYYAIYNAFRSILASYDNREHETHSAMIKSVNEIHAFLPHPFNMVATHQTGVMYSVMLPDYPTVERYNIVRNFRVGRSEAQGMLLSYLSGTARWEVKRVKDRLITDGQVDNFRTKAAREIRNRCLPTRVNFLNCAFRYRGKANYRDSLFLAYGPEDSTIDSSFMSGLSNIAKFAFLCGLAYAERRMGRRIVHEFLSDVRDNFRGRALATDRERFYENLEMEV
jgi:hypothetical protein